MKKAPKEVKKNFSVNILMMDAEDEEDVILDLFLSIDNITMNGAREAILKGLDALRNTIQKNIPKDSDCTMSD